MEPQELLSIDSRLLEILSAIATALAGGLLIPVVSAGFLWIGLLVQMDNGSRSPSEIAT